MKQAQRSRQPYMVVRKVVPTVGFELTTYRLQGGCSTPELCGHIFSKRIASSRMVLLRGVEPPTY